VDKGYLWAEERLDSGLKSYALYQRKVHRETE